MLNVFPDTGENPTELPTVHNPTSATGLAEVVSVEQGTFLWTAPCLPVLSIEWRGAKLSLNGVVYIRHSSEHQIKDFSS